MNLFFKILKSSSGTMIRNTRDCHDWTVVRTRRARVCDIWSAHSYTLKVLSLCTLLKYWVWWVGMLYTISCLKHLVTYFRGWVYYAEVLVHLKSLLDLTSFCCTCYTVCPYSKVYLLVFSPVNTHIQSLNIWVWSVNKHAWSAGSQTKCECLQMECDCWQTECVCLLSKHGLCTPNQN